MSEKKENTKQNEAKNVISLNRMLCKQNLNMMSLRAKYLFFSFMILLVLHFACSPYSRFYSKDLSGTGELPNWWDNRDTTQTQNNWIFQLGTNLNYQYYVEGIKYKSRINFSQGALLYYSENLNYRIYYNPEKPTSHMISMHEPILDEHLVKMNKVTVGKLEYTGKNKFSGAAFFSIQFRFFNNPNSKRNGLHGTEFCRSFYDSLPYNTHQNHHVYPLKHTFDDPYIFEPIWDKPFSLESTGTRLVTPMANDYPEKELTEAARELGDGGVIYWMPREQSLKQASPKMHKFLETYQPKDKDGNIIDVEIVIVDHEFIDKLNDNSYNE